MVKNVLIFVVCLMLIGVSGCSSQVTEQDMPAIDNEDVSAETGSEEDTSGKDRGRTENENRDDLKRDTSKNTDSITHRLSVDGIVSLGEPLQCTSVKSENETVTVELYTDGYRYRAVKNGTIDEGWDIDMHLLYDGTDFYAWDTVSGDGFILTDQELRMIANDEGEAKIDPSQEYAFHCIPLKNRGMLTVPDTISFIRPQDHPNYNVEG